MNLQIVAYLVGAVSI